MRLSGLLADDDAVSPVIGVILMVAITVILAAVIASLVLGLGDEPQQTPQAQFEFDFDEGPGDDGEGILTISHNGGNTIDPGEVEIRGSGEATGTFTGSPAMDWAGSTWESIGTGSDISTGSDLALAVTDGYDVTVTYVPSGGGDTAPMASDEGPAA